MTAEKACMKKSNIRLSEEGLFERVSAYLAYMSFFLLVVHSRHSILYDSLAVPALRFQVLHRIKEIDGHLRYISQLKYLNVLENTSQGEAFRG